MTCHRSFLIVDEQIRSNSKVAYAYAKSKGVTGLCLLRITAGSQVREQMVSL